MQLIILDTTTKKLQLVLGEAATTELDYTVAWADSTDTDVTEGNSNGTSNDTTAVDIVAAPAASTRRIIKDISVYNNDNISHTFTINYNDNGTLRKIWTGTLASGAIWYLSRVLSAGGGSPLTTKGDIYVFGSTNTRLGVGTNGYELTPDSSEATGLKWVTKYKTVIIQLLGGTTDTAVGDGVAYFTIPEDLNGMNLISVHGRVITAGTTGTTDFQIANVTDSVDMLSTKLTIDSGETGSDTAATPAVIDTTKDDVVTNDLLRIDCDAVSTTKAKGGIIRLRFALP